jgi:prepilin-type processing-associated H-X9-DG protein
MRKWIIIISGLLLVAVVALLWPLMRRDNRVPFNQAKCVSNLRQIGLGLAMYVNEHKQWPTGFPSLLTGEDLTADLVVCPFSNADRSEAKALDGLATDFEVPGKHVSYAYVADGLAPEERRFVVVVAYDLPDNHDHDGINVLFADGHTDWVTIGSAEEPNALWRSLEQQTRDHVRPVVLAPETP